MADQYDQTPAPVDSTSRGLFGLGRKKKEEVPSEAGEKVHVSEELSTGCQEKVEPTYDDSEKSGESTDRGLFGLGGKKKEEDAFNSEFEQKVKVSEDEPKKENLLHKLHRSDSSSSSSSDEEEVEEGGVKKKKLKDKVKDKIKGNDKKTEEDTSIPVEKYSDAPQPEEKKGFMEKIKEKLPGSKKTDEVAPTPAAAVAPPPVVAAEPTTPTEEKKGFMKRSRRSCLDTIPRQRRRRKRKRKRSEALQRLLWRDKCKLETKLL